MFTGIVGSHPEGVLSVGISPTSLCICRGSALIQHPMLDVYGSKGGAIQRRTSCDIAFACYFYKPGSFLCFNHVRCSHRACAVRGMIREMETGPVGGGVLFPYAI
jgi:hypothetical protein